MPVTCAPGLGSQHAADPVLRTDKSLKFFLLRMGKRFPSHPSSQGIYLRKRITVNTFSSFRNTSIKGDGVLSSSSVGTWLQVATPLPAIKM